MLEAIILGFIQGITEFLPISSTAHLILIPKFFGWQGPVDTLIFDISLHTGTLLAVLIYFRKDWLRLLIYHRRLLVFILIATIPAGVAGILFEETVERDLRSPYIIALSLFIIGLFMLVTDRLSSNKKLEDLGLNESIFIGFFQAIALIPGVSRSGITMSAGFLRGLKREDSARFSFMLSMPVIAGASILGFKKVFSGQLITSQGDYSLFISGMASSFISGLLAIGLLMKYLKTHRIDLFVYYRIGLAILIVLFF
jgi:undecaprenyl-diphosphatase